MSSSNIPASRVTSANISAADPTNVLAVDSSRRRFLKGAGTFAGAFILGAYVPFKGDHVPFRGEPVEDPVPVPQAVFDPNVFLKIGADDSVTILSKHFEMGQGVTTGLATLIADELEADWSKVRFEFAPADATLYNNLLFGPVMGTGGSSSMAESWVQMRQVGAAARIMFITAAAAKWSVPASEIKVQNSVVSHAGSGQKATFGQLAADAMRVPVPKEVTLKSPQARELIGTRVPRLDSLGKTTGKAIFALDIRRPGMLTAVLKRPDVFGAKIVSFDATEARKVDGVVDVVQISTAVAVLANDTWSALRGRDALKVVWDTSAAETRSSAEILDEYRQLANGQGLTAINQGDAVAGVAHAAKTHEAEFTFPYLAHAPMEPLNGTIEVRSDSAEIWLGSQLQTVDQMVTAHVLGLKPQQVKINTLLGGGSFGRRANPVGDWARELAEVGKAINGRAPVHLIWTREDDIKGGFYRPMVLHRVKAGIDANGRIAGWQHKVVSKSIFIGTPFEQMGVKDGLDHSTVEGIVDTPYRIENFAVDVHNAKSPVTVLWFRSVGHTHTGHVMETTIDELAHLAGKDPVAFRLDLLSEQPRDAAVVRFVAEKAGWNRPWRGGPNRARGFAYHHSFNTRVGMVAEVLVTPPTIKVERVVAAVDCGVPINPDVITAQIEGAIGFALAAVLRNQVTLKQGVVQQSNFDDYEPTRMREMPQVEVHVMKSEEAPSGIGEPGVPPLAPAIGNAIFAATGKRLRSLPFDLKALA
jgi:isoquinoline 1-oxidoreductase beta subunit